MDVSPMIDVVKLEEYFATKQSVKEVAKPAKNQEKQNYLDSKRSQNIGLFSGCPGNIEKYWEFVLIQFVQ